MRTIAIVNQKGGCGKTTTSINLAAFLAREKRRTLIVDLDPQGHSSLGLHAEPDAPSRTLYDVFAQHANGGGITLRDVLRPVATDLDVAPASILLSDLTEHLAGHRNRERFLAEILDEVGDRYDYAIVDCPPQVGLMTFNALTACGEALVPVDPSFFSLHGLGKQLETIEALARKTGHRITVRVLITLFAGRSPFSRAVIDDIRGHLEDRCFKTIIRYSVKLAEAASHGLPIAAYCRDCAGFDDYRALAREILETEGTPTGAWRRADDRSAADSPWLPSAPMVTSDGVRFALSAPSAGRVQLVGDFNAWMPDAGEMTPVGAVWTSMLKLPPGRYRYRYIVDGMWCSDPLNGEVEQSPYGGSNSVVVVAGPTAGAVDAA